jgi:hypothetical protein
MRRGFQTVSEKLKKNGIGADVGCSEWPKRGEDGPSRPREPPETGHREPSSYFPNSFGKGNSRKSKSTILHSPIPIRAGESLLPRPSTAERPQDVGVLNSYAPRCNTRITKSPEFRFHAVLNENAPEVRFARGDSERAPLAAGSLERG